MDYIAEAQQTKSTSFHGNLVSKRDFAYAVITAIDALKRLDSVKKALFYGKPFYPAKSAPITEVFENCNGLNFVQLHNTPQSGLDLLHAIIGKATEAGESLEALYATVIDDKPFDFVNCAEEIGDGFWYDAIALKVLGFSFEDVQRVNIEKLRARFPNKFTEYDANNRNLSAERTILEDGHSQK